MTDKEIFKQILNELSDVDKTKDIIEIEMNESIKTLVNQLKSNPFIFTGSKLEPPFIDYVHQKDLYSVKGNFLILKLYWVKQFIAS